MEQNTVQNQTVAQGNTAQPVRYLENSKKMNEILNTEIGSSVHDGKMSVSFKKTVLIRQYETEVIEANLEFPMTPEDMKRIPYIETIALAKLEYSVLFQLYASGQISQGEFEQRKYQLELAATAQENYVNSNYGLNNQS